MKDLTLYESIILLAILRLKDNAYGLTYIRSSIIEGERSGTVLLLSYNPFREFFQIISIYEVHSKGL
ncbi:MAG: hypothetical protein WBF32_04230 [Candidatus Aminicenantaceae bacterium]